MNSRIGHLELLQNRQQQTAQRALTCREKYRSVFEIPASRYSRLSGLKLRTGNADVPVQRFALRRQNHPAVRP